MYAREREADMWDGRYVRRELCVSYCYGSSEEAPLACARQYQWCFGRESFEKDKFRNF